MRQFKNIQRLINEQPKIEEYINIIKESSLTVDEDLANLDYVAANHTSEQFYGFLPKYISIAGWCKENELQIRRMQEDGFFENRNLMG